MATAAAYSTFRRVWSDPASMASRSQYEAQVATYDYRWHLYQNSVFDDVRLWQAYKSYYRLYRYIRPIYNPVRRLVDFYAGMVYPGTLATDAKRLPNGAQLAIPLAQDTDPEVLNAVGQLWQWSNWQTGKNLYVRYGAALGDVGVEVVDEVDRGKVTFDVIWPGMVTELELDTTGNVKRHVIEYDFRDEDGHTYTYKKEVDGEYIAEYRDDELYRYDPAVPAKRVNPYGFDPFVWCKHTDLGGLYGSPAVRNIGKIDELNELASHAHDRAHAVLSSPILLSGEGVQALTDEVTTTKGRATADQSNPGAGRESTKLFKSNGSGSMSTVQLPEGEAMHYIEKLIEEIEHDHPEIVMYNQLRQMSQVTGPAAEALVGDTLAYVQEARSNYDTQSIKLFQMGVAIAGWRANSGDWGSSLTTQQQAFIPFGLESYQAGDLDMEIMPRPLVPVVQQEQAQPNGGQQAAQREQV